MGLFKKKLFAKRPDFSDGIIDLYPSDLVEANEELGVKKTFMFRISPCETLKNAGRISLRIGESRELYYFGHIGYHVNEGYRGNHYALNACSMMLPLLRALGVRSLVITTDVDNIPSRKTCERLGCKLESIVFVPQDLQRRFDLPEQKCRYILVVE
jgi:Predicted acetyltransferase